MIVRLLGVLSMQMSGLTGRNLRFCSLAVCLALLHLSTKTNAAVVSNQADLAPTKTVEIIQVQQTNSDKAVVVRKMIQRRLRDIGLYGGAIDGILGPASTEALVNFRELAGIEGKFNSESIELLVWAAKIAKARPVSASQAIRDAPTAVSASHDSDQADAANKDGRYPEAKRLYQRAVAGFERALGENHPNTMHAIRGLADVYFAQSQYSEAENLGQSVLKQYKRTAGSGVPPVSWTVKGLRTPVSFGRSFRS